MNYPKILDDNGHLHDIEVIDWKWTNAAGWDDVYDGQRGKVITTKGETVYGYFCQTGRALSERPRDY